VHRMQRGVRAVRITVLISTNNRTQNLDSLNQKLISISALRTSIYGHVTCDM
jgi:hypothetical protein